MYYEFPSIILTYIAMKKKTLRLENVLNFAFINYQFFLIWSKLKYN